MTLAQQLLAWTGRLALTGHPARRWEPKRRRLRLSRTAPWTPLRLSALHRLTTVPTPVPDTS